MLKHSLYIRKKGFRNISGNSKNICKQIVNNCYNNEKNYFMISNGHFCEFWTRDFGLCVDSLKKLGFEKKIKNTLDYSLKIFENKKLCTTINPSGKTFNFPNYAPDSLAFMLHSLITLEDKYIIKKYSEFLEKEAKKYFKIVIEKDSGLVKKKRFSSMKDHSIRNSSCYDNIMSAWISKNLRKMKLENPLKSYNFKKIIKNNFWTGNYFIDDLSGKKKLSGDANVFPFWTKIFNSKKMIKDSVEKIKIEKLDKPFPLKYSVEKTSVNKYDFLAKNYQTGTIWPMIGYPYIEVVSKINKKLAKEYIDIYSKIIEKNKNFLEVYDYEGKPYKSKFYYSDEEMLWASKHLSLLKLYS